MNETPGRRDDAAARAAHELARLTRKVEAMRAVLGQLLQGIAQAEKQLDDNKAMQLLEANERLVIGAMHAHYQAETAAGALDEATRLGGIDPLTQLPNRALLLDRMAQALSHARRHGNRVALLFLDLNNFKQINDRFGHATGDHAIQLAAACLASLVRETDTVSRHGGDEFLILLGEVSQPTDAALIAEKVNAALGEHTMVNGHPVAMTASIGISIYPEDGRDARTLIDRADAAMYLAKQYARGAFVFHADLAAGAAESPFPALLSPDESEAGMLAHDQRPRHAQLREANEQLVLATLAAQELQAVAEQARRRQARSLSLVALELSDPFAPIRIAAAMLGGTRVDPPAMLRARALIEQQLDQLSRAVNDLIEPAPTSAGSGA